MVEMRWLVRPVKVKVSNGFELSSYVETVLQYRQKIDQGSHYPNICWTDWVDVPKVQEELP